MQINYNVLGADRKALVKVMGEILGVAPKYLGMPSAAYEVDYFRIGKDGTVEFDDMADTKEVEILIKGLAERGFCAVSADDVPKEETIPKTENALKNANLGLTIEIPKERVNAENIKNIIKAKGKLIKKAMGTVDLSVEIGEKTVKFPWFGRLLDPNEVKAYTKFIEALCKLSGKLKRTSTKPKEIVNEKYAFRCFLLRLGFIGAEFKDERKVLLKNLEGSSSFKSPKKP